MVAAAQLDEFRRRQSRAPPGSVDVAANRGQRRDRAERIENGRVANVSGMKDVIDASQRCNRLGSKQAVSIGDDAYPHRRSKPDRQPGAGIEIVAQRIAEEIERKHAEHDCQRGKDHHMRRVEEVRARVIEHISPACRRRRNA